MFSVLPKISRWRTTRSILQLESIRIRHTKIHTTAPRSKKKKVANDLLEDEGDLFGTDSAAVATSSTQRDLKSHSSSSTAREDTVRTFNQLVDHMVPRLGRKPEIATPIRKGALTQLINLANNREQLENVAEIIKLYHDNDSQKGVLEDTDSGDAFITRCIALEAPDTLLKVIQKRPKYGLTLTQRRLHRILYYLVTSKPDLKAPSSQTENSESSPFDHFIAALSLLPTYQKSSAANLDSAARSDPVVMLCLLNLALSLPIPQEQFADLQAAIDDVTSHLGKRATGDEKWMKQHYPVVERSQLMSMMKQLKSNLDKLTGEGLQIKVPPFLIENLEKLPMAAT